MFSFGADKFLGEFHCSITFTILACIFTLCVDIGMENLDNIQLVSSYSPVKYLFLCCFCIEKPGIVFLHNWYRQKPVIFPHTKNHLAGRYFLKLVHLLIGIEELFTSYLICYLIPRRY